MLFGVPRFPAWTIRVGDDNDIAYQLPSIGAGIPIAPVLRDLQFCSFGRTVDKFDWRNRIPRQTVRIEGASFSGIGIRRDSCL